MKNIPRLKTLRLPLLLIVVLVWILFPISPSDAARKVKTDDLSATATVDQTVSGIEPSTVADVTMEWEPNPEDSVAGYLLYYGNASRKYLPPIDVGLNTNHTVPDLNTEQQWFFAVKAYDTEGNRSDYSNEVIKDQAVTSQTGSTDSTATSFTHAPLALNQNFGEESELSYLPGTSGASKIVAGTGPWTNDGGWIKTLTQDYFHEHWSRMGWPYYNDLRGESRVAHGDIDGDGKNEIIIGMGSVENDVIVPYGHFQVLDDDYQHLFWGMVTWGEYNEGNGETWPACGDIDGDGVDEILIGLGKGGTGMIEVFSVKGKRLKHHSWITSTWPEYNQAMGEVRPASGDFGGDGKDDIIVGFGPVADNPEIPGGAYEILSGKGEHMTWGEIGWTDYNQLNGESRPAIGDLNGDGANEIIIGLGSGSNGAFEIQGFNDEGKLANQSWLEIPWWQEYNELSGETRPALGNLDGDDADELVIALGQGGGGWIHLFDDRDSGYNHYISLQLWPEEYNLNNGASWVTIKK